MAEFMVGDKIRLSGNTFTCEVTEVAWLGPSGKNNPKEQIIKNSLSAGYWHKTDGYEIVPVNKRFEIVRIIEAEDADKALQKYATSKTGSVEAREIK